MEANSAGLSKRALVGVFAFALALLAGVGLWHHFAALRFTRPPDDPGYRKILDHFREAQPAGVNISPDGKYLLTKAEAAGGFKISVLDRDGKHAIASDLSRDSQLALTWRPDSSAIAFQEIAGMDRPLFILDLQSGEKRPLSAPSSQTSLPPLRWSPSGKRLAYFEGDIRTGRLLVVNPDQDDQPTVVQSPISSACDFVWSPDGTRIAATSGPDGAVTITVLRSLEQKRIQVLTGEIQTLAWSPDGKRILATASRPSDEFFQLYEIDVNTEAVSLKAQANGDIRQPLWMPDSKAFIYHVSSNGITRAFLAGAKGVSCIGPTNGVLHLSHLGPDGKTVYGHFSGLTTPPVLGQVALDSGDWTLLYACPESEQCRCPEPEFITVKSRDGTEVPAYHWPAVRRPGAEPAALIVVHGGARTQTYPTWEAYIQLITGLGCDVIAENHRGSSGYGRSYEKLPGEPGEDILAACRYAQDTLKVRPDHIFLHGLSTGAHCIGDATTHGDEFGGVFLVSWPGAPAPAEPHFQHAYPIAEFHGEIDAVLSPGGAHHSLQRFYQGSPLNIDFHVFQGEGHFFYRSESLAYIYWQISRLIQP